ncbi:MAG: hypothetical protein V1926_01490 [Candidatus Peregrinibacteria bacterium]
MRRTPLRDRAGTSLVELILFLGFFAACAGAVFSVLAFTNEQRLRQQIAAYVDQQGTQLLSVLTRRVRGAEHILWPETGTSSTVLMLQMGDASLHPTVIALQSGALLLIERDHQQILSPENMVISHFSVRNTSVALSGQSALLSFRAERTIAFPGIRPFSRTFETVIALFPNHVAAGDECGCPLPACEEGRFHWNICTDGICSESPIEIFCTCCG